MEVGRALVTAGADVNQAMVSCHCDSEGSSVAALTCVLETHCWVSLCRPLQIDGASPLYVACESGHVEVVRALLGVGAAVNQAKVRVLVYAASRLSLN